MKSSDFWTFLGVGFTVGIGLAYVAQAFGVKPKELNQLINCNNDTLNKEQQFTCSCIKTGIAVYPYVGK